MPDEVEFATKVQMARTMLARALDSGVPVGWVTMDEAYGQSKSLRWLEHREVALWSRPAATTTCEVYQGSWTCPPS
ncbi:transposase [Micromonospora echinospora]|uniref:transposase n=1 Tax=Micromonospora echinospora TaxID=1877 RepID=UPI0039C1A44B